jgi:hypothetical protein
MKNVISIAASVLAIASVAVTGVTSASVGAVELSDLRVTHEALVSSSAAGAAISSRDASCVGGLDIHDRTTSCVWDGEVVENTTALNALVQG